jgi:membrane-bound lytic murein transglycosylase D
MSARWSKICQATASHASGLACTGGQSPQVGFRKELCDGMMNHRLAFAAAGALLLNFPAFATNPSAPIDNSTSSADAGMQPTSQAFAAMSTSHVLPRAPGGELFLSARHPESPVPDDSAPIIGGAPPSGAEPVVEVLEAPPAPKYKDLWGRLRAGFSLPDRKGRLVAEHEAWYLNRPAYVQRSIERSHRYLYFIIEELEKRNMPTEIALLPMIESAYNPQARSPMRATGIWQFIPETGRRYGLEQNFWYDGRRDVLAATRAALDYLQFLHNMFGDWELALAAYNWGEGAVQRALAYNRAHHRATNCASLQMPKETRNYLPKLQAVKNIIANAKSRGLELEAIPNEPYFAVVKTPAHIDVLKAAQLANMPVEEFRSLNAGYNRPVIIQAAARQIVLPIDKVDQFHANLENNGDPLVTWQAYTLQPRDTLRKVASKFNISVDRLRDVNSLYSRKRVRAGQILLVPFERERDVVALGERYSPLDLEASPETYAGASGNGARSGKRRAGIGSKRHVSVARAKP